MINPDLKVLKALAVLEHNGDFKIVMQWFDDSLADQNQLNSTAKDVVVARWGQGKSQELTSAIETMRNARAIVERANT